MLDGDKRKLVGAGRDVLRLTNLSSQLCGLGNARELEELSIAFRLVHGLHCCGYVTEAAVELALRTDALSQIEQS